MTKIGPSSDFRHSSLALLKNITRQAIFPYFNESKPIIQFVQQFVNYKSFNDKALARELYIKLTEQGISVEYEDSEGFFDPSFVKNDILMLYYIKLRAEDFSKADEILRNLIKLNGEKLDEDYYLFAFSNDELLDILKHPDEWNEFDCYWTQKILEDRNVKINAFEIEKSKTERIEELRKPWNLDKAWIIGALVLIILAYRYLHIFLAFGAIFLGLYISGSKKTLPDGEQVKAFSADDRLLGKIVLVAGVVIMLFILLWGFGFSGLERFPPFRHL